MANICSHKKFQSNRTSSSRDIAGYVEKSQNNPQNDQKTKENLPSITPKVAEILFWLYIFVLKRCHTPNFSSIAKSHYSSGVRDEKLVSLTDNVLYM